MADDFTTKDATGATVTGAADDIVGIKYPRFKLNWGVDGSRVDASATDPLPVVQTGTPALPTGATTETTLSTRLSESDFDTKTGSLTETAPATDTASSGLNGRLQRIAQRITSLITALGSPFQAGGSIGNTSFAATQATASSLNAQTASVAAVLPAATTMQNAATANGNGTNLPVTGYTTAVLNVVSSVAMSGGTTINFEASVDDTTFVSIAGHQIGNNGSLQTTTTADGDFRINCAGYKSIRARISAYSAGTITVKGYTLSASGTGTAVALATGTNTIGSIATIGTSVTPGTAATNLGKPEDGVHSSGDVGVMALGVSNENATVFAAASGDYIPQAVNRYGAIYTAAWPPSHASSNGTPITATTTSVIAAPSAGNHLRVVRIHISNGGATATWISIRDGAAGTQYYRTFLPQNGVLSLNLKMSGPLDLTTATRLDIVLSAAGSVEYTIDYLTVSD